MKGQEKENKFSIILGVLVIVISGLAGFFTYFLLMVFSRLNIGRDPLIKHGLTSGSSRLGGLVIFISTFTMVPVNLYLVNALSFKSFVTELNYVFLISILIGLIGLAEDFSHRVKSSHRLAISFCIVFIGLYLNPEMLPLDLPIFSLLNLDSIYAVYLFTTIMIVGFINAGNMTDGANGLLSIISLIFILFLYSVSTSMLNLSLIIGLSSFIIYNITTGRIFLGDFGAYFLSSFVAFSSLTTYAQYDLPVFLFASLLVYPCFEIVRSIILRLVSGESIMSPDNKHLHNYIHDHILTYGLSRQIINSLTGVFIAVLSSGPAFYIFLTFPEIREEFWIMLFVIEILLLSLTYLILSNKLNKTLIKK